MASGVTHGERAPGIPILSDVLGGSDAAPSDITCAVVDDDEDD